MKVLLIHPPLAFPFTLYASTPILLGQLKNNGIDADALDMNVEFLKDSLSSRNILKTKEMLEEAYKHRIKNNEHKAFLENILYTKKDKTEYIINNADKLYKSMISEEEREKMMNFFNTHCRLFLHLIILQLAFLYLRTNQ